MWKQFGNFIAPVGPNLNSMLCIQQRRRNKGNVLVMNSFRVRSTFKTQIHFFLFLKPSLTFSPGTSTVRSEKRLQSQIKSKGTEKWDLN